MNERIKVGSVVQISPELENKLFAGCFMQVTEVKSWGVQGFVNIPQSRNEIPGSAYFRCKYDDCEYIGDAVWVVK